jgi:hypothetical protein
MGCQREPPKPHRADWVIDTQLVFFNKNQQAIAAPWDAAQVRLWFPGISGDFYGTPNIGALFNATLSAEFNFQIDLNTSVYALTRSLVDTQFTLPWLSITPATARIARVLPFVLPADGINSLGETGWFDPQTRQRLWLLYFDQPTHILGQLTNDKVTFRYNIRAPAAGYFWVVEHQKGQQREWRVVKPRQVVLAVWLDRD